MYFFFSSLISLTYDLIRELLLHADFVPQINGRQCEVSPSLDNDILFIGNIKKTWTKEIVSTVQHSFFSI